MSRHQPIRENAACSGDNIIGPRCLRALQELGTARVYRSRRRGSRVIEFALLAEHGEDGSDLAGWDLVGGKRKFRAREHSRIFFEHLFREAGMDQALMDRQEDKRFISPGREKAGNQHIGVDNRPDHDGPTGPRSLLRR